MSQARRSQLKKEKGDWQDCIEALTLMHTTLEGGYRKRAHLEKKKRIQERRTEDLARIKALPRLVQIREGAFSVVILCSLLFCVGLVTAHNGFQEFPDFLLFQMSYITRRVSSND